MKKKNRKIEKSIGLWIIYVKASSNSACGVKYRRNCKKSTDYMSKIVVHTYDTNQSMRASKSFGILRY